MNYKYVITGFWHCNLYIKPDFRDGGISVIHDFQGDYIATDTPPVAAKLSKLGQLVGKPLAISTSHLSTAPPPACSDLPCSDAVTLVFLPQFYEMHTFHRPSTAKAHESHSSPGD